MRAPFILPAPSESLNKTHQYRPSANGRAGIVLPLQRSRIILGAFDDGALL
jgi:hypothetical protein